MKKKTAGNAAFLARAITSRLSSTYYKARTTWRKFLPALNLGT